jgi:hypothetical protein
MTCIIQFAAIRINTWSVCFLVPSDIHLPSSDAPTASTAADVCPHQRLHTCQSPSASIIEALLIPPIWTPKSRQTVEFERCRWSCHPQRIWSVNWILEVGCHFDTVNLGMTDRHRCRCDDVEGWEAKSSASTQQWHDNLSFNDKAPWQAAVKTDSEPDCRVPPPCVNDVRETCHVLLPPLAAEDLLALLSYMLEVIIIWSMAYYNMVLGLHELALGCIIIHLGVVIIWVPELPLLCAHSNFLVPINHMRYRKLTYHNNTNSRSWKLNGNCSTNMWKTHIYK